MGSLCEFMHVLSLPRKSEGVEIRSGHVQLQSGESERSVEYAEPENEGPNLLTIYLSHLTAI